MKLFPFAVPALVALTALTAMPASAQTTAETKVSNDTSVKDGVVTRKHKVVQVKKHKTHRAKRILGVKVGHKTNTTKIVHETTTDSAGNASTKVTTSH